MKGHLLKSKSFVVLGAATPEVSDKTESCLTIPTGHIFQELRELRDVSPRTPMPPEFAQAGMILAQLPLPRTESSTEPFSWCSIYPGTKEAVIQTLKLSTASQRPSNAPTSPIRIGQVGNGDAGEGLGVFATRDIKPGELIVSERPLFVFPLQIATQVGTTLETVYSHYFGRVDSETRQKLLELCNCKEEWPSYGIIATNGLTIGGLPGPYQGPHGAICHQISRINHSCSPNATKSWDINSFSCEVRATYPIPKNTQIFIAYHDMLSSRDARRRELKRKYAFDCACSACSVFDRNENASRDSDFARAFLYLSKLDPNVETELERWLQDRHLSDDFIIKDSLKWLGLMEREGICHEDTWVPHIQRLVKCYCALRDARNAKKWALKGGVWTRAYYGTDGGWDAIAKSPEKTNWWGLRK